MSYADLLVDNISLGSWGMATTTTGSTLAVPETFYGGLVLLLHLALLELGLVETRARCSVLGKFDIAAWRRTSPDFSNTSVPLRRQDGCSVDKILT